MCSFVWWLRSPNTGNSNNVYNVTTSGTQGNNNANNSYGVSLDCLINRLNISSKQNSEPQLNDTNKEQYSLPKKHKQVKKNRRLNCLLNKDIIDISYDVFSFQNLFKAAKLCLKGVSWKNSVIKYKINILLNVFYLYTLLKNHKYHQTQSVKFYIYRPKKRIVNSLLFQDRVVAKTIVKNGLYEILLKDRIYDNCACQKRQRNLFCN